MTFSRKLVYFNLNKQIQCTSNIQELDEMFRQIDKNGDGVLCRDELITAYGTLLGNDFTTEQIADYVSSLLESVDMDADNQIDYSEFVSSTMYAQYEQNFDKYVHDTWEVLDSHRRG